MIDPLDPEVQELMRIAGSEPIQHEASEMVDEGLRITCKTPEDARRLQAAVRIMVPRMARHLVECADRVVLVRYAEGQREWEEGKRSGVN